MTGEHVKRALDVLCGYYTDREGGSHKLNSVQIAAYIDAFVPFQPNELEAAAKAWIRQSAWFPTVADLLPLCRAERERVAREHENQRILTSGKELSPADPVKVTAFLDSLKSLAKARKFS